ncbi:hypothetical protein E1B28_004475 [Marasmius oreades]|uniref:Uncharacterized protein n=1 Tax=Marasmius oreades TaxID=181124 RepID=A0A9P7UYM4_9AGAR|nr:uncharacterized protein E1B28_004475 [Marasmius oreades]KAG7097089.1 hypothetical protein E1B28_004475 [Marasmius oreades]
MCYPEGSVQHAVNACPMCKVFPHPARCPHLREVCRNRSLHPRADYLFLTNAEVETFNGCGFCKWARSDPPAKASGMNNPGWPGCCRPPASNEYRMIPAADWRSVSIVHSVSLPPEIKSALDILSPPTPRVPFTTSSSSLSLRNPFSKSAMPPLDRRSSGSPPSKSIAASKSSAAVSTSPKTRSGGSPKQSAASLSGSMSRATGSVASTSLDQSSRRTGGTDASEKSGSRSAHSSPNRKQLDLDNQVSPRRNSGGRTSTSITTSPTSTAGKTVGERSSASDRRRATISATNPPNSSPSIRNTTTTASFTSPRSSQKDAGNMSSGSSNNGSDDRSSDSMSDNTITSDGGFTDYLSDESEAELQRQAEAKAALLAQNQAEELEFKAARQRLAHVDLNPPKSWNPTNITNNTNVPRLAQTGKV